MSAKIKHKPWWLTTPCLYALMIGFGIYSGWSDIGWLKSLGLLIADLFINIFKCISLPIISLSIIVTLSNYSATGSMQSIWRRAMTYTLTTTVIAATISCFLYWFIHPSMMNTTPSLSTTSLATHQFNYLNHLSQLIPSSFLAPFIKHQVLSVLLLSILIGISVRFIPEKTPRQTITAFFKGAHSLLMVITGWIIKVIPIGLYGFITTTVVQLRAGSTIKGIGEYLLIVILANLIQGFIILPAWLKTQGIRPFHAMKKMMPALSVAFFTKSSVGTLPITMNTAEKNLGVKPEVSRFVLPLCTSLNMNGCAAFIFATVIYLMQNHGITITMPTMVLWILISTIAAIGNAGVPMGCFFLSASLLASMNVPITLMGLILPFYSLIDMLETALNVWSDSCVAKVVNDKQSETELNNCPSVVGNVGL